MAIVGNDNDNNNNNNNNVENEQLDATLAIVDDLPSTEPEDNTQRSPTPQPIHKPLKRKKRKTPTPPPPPPKENDKKEEEEEEKSISEPHTPHKSEIHKPIKRRRSAPNAKRSKHES
eukprot:12699_1